MAIDRRCTTMADDDGNLHEGDVVAGKYRVERVLGTGGMGIVVAAHHIGLDTRIAIKFLRPELAANRDAVARFMSEARSAVRIKSEYVARVFDVGTLESGAPYMVMEYLEGGDLATWLEKRGALAIDQAVEFMLQVCVAAADAHALGIVHRDLKPANFFCARRSDGQLSIKVLDFGISKVTGGDSSGQVLSVTRTNSLMGSPLYMSPEQLRSPKDVDAQTDIWAIGASLYELLTATVPFYGDSIAMLALKLETQTPPPLRGLRPEIPSALEAVVLKCLERDRSQRYQNVAELAVALLPFAPRSSRAQVERISAIIRTTGLATTGMSLPPSRQAPAGDGAGSIPPVGSTRSSMNRTKQLTGIAGIFMVLGGVAAFGYVALRNKPTETAAGTANGSAHVAAVNSASAASESASAPGPLVLNPVAEPQPSPQAAPVGPRTPPASSQLALPNQPVESHADPRSHPDAARTPQPPPAPKPASKVPAAVETAEPKPPTTSCTPPFYFDDKGARVFKKECVR